MNDTPMNVRPDRSRRVSPQRRNVSLVLALALAGSGGSMAAYGASDTPAWVPGRILVQPRPGLPEAALEKILKAHGGKSVGRIEAIGVHIVQLPPNASEKAVAALLSKNKHLKFAEPDMIYKPDTTANDPYFGNAWHLPKIQATTAWGTTRGDEITIAILDSGVDANHADLAGKLVAGWNFYDNNSNTSDVYGHGTKVAGAAAATTDNAMGVASVAGNARIMPIRITDTSGMGYTSMMAKGLTWAADRGVRVANISFGGAGSSTVQSAAQYLKNKGGLLIMAAGNSGSESTIAPSDTLVVVSGTTSSDARASWSSYGRFVDVAAPGAGIWTTVRGGSYSAVSGTSFASPVTAGVVALMMAANPVLSPSDIEKHLFSSSVDLGSAGVDKYYGYGRINAAAAVLAVQGAAPADTTAPTAAIASPTGGATVAGLVPISVSASDNVGVSRVELLVNGSKLASDTTSPYGFSWDSTQLADGTATLTAYSYDATGNYSSHTVTVKVANTTETTADTSPPAAVISNPTSGTTVNGAVAIQASASDNVGVTQLKLYIDGALKSSVNGDSLSYKWNTKKAAKGTHTLKIEARDAAGNVGSRSVQVSN